MATFTFFELLNCNLSEGNHTHRMLACRAETLSIARTSDSTELDEVIRVRDSSSSSMSVATSSSTRSAVAAVNEVKRDPVEETAGSSPRQTSKVPYVCNLRILKNTLLTLRNLRSFRKFRNHSSKKPRMANTWELSINEIHVCGSLRGRASSRSGLGYIKIPDTYTLYDDLTT